MKIFSGSAVALVTPFDKSGEINYKTFERLLEFQLENNTQAVIISGTTGESATLSDQEKLDLISFAVNKCEKKVPIIAGTGSNNTKHALDLTIRAKNLGADACLIVTPYYNKTSQAGLIQHYKKISEADLPIIIYNVPSRTGLNILPDTYKKLFKLKNIIGLKEANNNISQVAETFYLCDYLYDGENNKNNFCLYSGNDDQIIPVLSLGGSGVISVLANIFPRETNNICQDYFNGDIKKSRDTQIRFLDLIKNLFCDINPIPIKFAMNYMGLNVGETRLPLTDLSPENKNKLITSLKKFI
jgi:4-hydroxy-tetrahydrodipicolinate synthase